MIAAIAEIVVSAIASVTACLVLMRRRRTIRQERVAGSRDQTAPVNLDGQAVVEVVSQREWLLNDRLGRLLVKVDGARVGYANANGGSCRAEVTAGAHTVRTFSWPFASPPVLVEVSPGGVRLYADVEKSIKGYVRLLFRPRSALYLSETADVASRPASST